MTQLLAFASGSICAFIFLSLGYELDWPSLILGVVSLLLADILGSAGR